MGWELNLNLNVSRSAGFPTPMQNSTKLKTRAREIYGNIKMKAETKALIAARQRRRFRAELKKAGRMLQEIIDDALGKRR